VELDELKRSINSKTMRLINEILKIEDESMMIKHLSNSQDKIIIEKIEKVIERVLSDEN
jgi:hypothetical protein